MKIPVYERQVGFGGLPNAAVSGVGNAASFGHDVGGAVQGLGGRLMKIQQDREDARTFELMNEFKRESFVYHEDAEKGVYNTRKFGNASNVYADSDEWLAGKIEDYAGRAPSGRAARNFRRMAEQYRAQRGERNSRFEADQLRAYRDAECDASVALAVDSAAGNFDDDAAFNAAVNDIDEALAFKTEGMGDGAKQAARDDAISKLAQARLEAMAQADPERAEEWFNANKGLFKGSDLAKLAARLSNASLGRRLINEVDEAFESYDNEADALEYLRGRFADPEEYERAAKRYKAKAADAEAAYRKREKQWIDEITDDIANSGSLEEALAIIQERGADGDDRVKLEAYAASVFKTEKVNEHPLHYLQAFEEVTSGKLPDLMSFHARWGEYLNNDTIKTLGKMYITGNFGGGSGAAGSQYVGYSLAESIKGRIKALKLEGAQAASMITYMNDVINSAKAEKRRGGGGALSPNDIEAMLDDCVKKEIINGSEGLFGLGGVKTFTYIQRQAEEQGYKWDSSSNKYMKMEGELVYEIDPKNMEYDPNSGAIEKREAAPLPPLPEKPNAAPVKREAGVRMMRDGSAFDEGLLKVPGKRRKAELKDGDILSQMVDGGRVSSAFGPRNAPLKGASRDHGGVDYAAPGGSSIRLPNIGGGMEVVKVENGHKGYGTYAVLRGKDSGGRTVEMTIAHMEDGSADGLKAGQRLKAGELIGRVGSTGKSTGPHMHLEIKVDGKRVDPQKYMSGKKKVSPPDFSVEFDSVLNFEGGRRASGGKTVVNMGITPDTLAEAKKSGLVGEDVSLDTLTRDDAEKIYLEKYWKPARIGDMPAKIGRLHFDASVGLGLKGARDIMRAALADIGVTAEGGIDGLVKAVNGLDDDEASRLADAMADERLAAYKRRPDWKKYGAGWSMRVEKLRGLI